MKQKKGFTLIELLIVVAIIGILAAIAIPNFLQAQTRAKVAKAQSDMRTIATGIELFHTDRGFYPVACNINISAANAHFIPVGMPSGTCVPVSRRFIQLTTPVDYLTTHFAGEDPFQPTNILAGYDSYDYFSIQTWLVAFGGTHPNAAAGSGTVRGAHWRLASAGPDRFHSFGGPAPPAVPPHLGLNYDPTNGTISFGDIVHVGPQASDPGRCMYPDRVIRCW